MLEEIADLKFPMEPRFKDEPKDTADMVKRYETNFNRALSSPRHDTGATLYAGGFLRHVQSFRGLLPFSFVNNHSIRHRGQLSAYLRPMGFKVPSIYGGSAGEPWPS
jgi:DinB family